MFVILNLALGISPLFAQEPKQEQKSEPIIINGDTVEYSTTGKSVTVSGNAAVIYKGAKLTCRKMTMNTETKEGIAEGNVRLEEEKGVIEAERAIYNFNNKAGTLIKPIFRSNPYFGKAKEVDKINDAEFIAKSGYITTCDYDNPHYRLKSRKIHFFSGDKVQVRDMVMYTGAVPTMYLPRYNHSLKDPLMHVQLMPGTRKDWGAYMLSAWRYSLADDVNGRIYLDFREKMGVSEGFGLNYKTHKFGKGDYKYYYTQERNKGKELGSDLSTPREFERYLIRWRHMWDIGERTNVTAQYYKITDSKRAIYGSQYNFLKDYFFREYEKDTQPPSYILTHHSFSYSNLDVMLQKRANRWYDSGYLEKLPEITYSLPSVEIAESPFYFENSSSAANLNKKMTVHSTTPDVHVNRLDTTNKFSLPMKVSIMQFKPFVADRSTFYDKDINGSSIPPRTVFYTGADMSTKFYRVFNVKSNFLGLDVNGLRHIITPTAGYAYNHAPTIQDSRLRQLDGVDSIGSSNSASLELSNKLQTKRKNKTVDMLDFRTTSSYIFKPKSGDKRGSNLSDILFDLKLLPYSWMRIDADATYKHSGNRSDASYRRFSNANYDVNFDFGGGRSIGIGQRYQLKGGNEFTYSLDWRLNPLWKFSLYQRRNIGHDPSLKRGLREQQYGISRDLHCWIMDVTYRVKQGEGESIWLVFRLKAFPELEFGYDQTYHQPKPGSQSNQ